MEILAAYMDAVWSSVASSTQRLHWMYLLTALFAGVVSYKLYAGERFTLRGFLRYVLPAHSITSRSARMDYLIVLLAPFWLVFFLAPFFISVLAMAEATIQLLEFIFGANNTVTSLGIPHLVLFSVVLFLVFDFAEYLAHYLQHRVWFLWEFHKIHHSAEVLNPVTAYRFHPFDVLFTGAAIAILTGICQGVFHWWWAVEPQPFKVFGLQLGVFAFYLAAYNLRHSHVWLPYPQSVSHVLMSPAQHQIHHSVEKKHWNKNMGFVLSIWDWAFGTLYVPKEREKLTYGIGGNEEAEYQSLLAIYALPFRKISKELRKRQQDRQEAKAVTADAAQKTREVCMPSHTLEKG